MSKQSNHCPDCKSKSIPTRREFLHTTAAAGASAVVAASGIPAVAKEGDKAEPETLIAQLYSSLDAKQRKLCTFSFDHPLRGKVNNNWNITKTKISRDFNKDQQDLIRQIFVDLHSPEYSERVMEQVEHDGGFADCSIALFGKPASDGFEFVLTGRHVTRRADGDSIQGAAFGGPIFYGHAAESFDEPPDHPGNVYWYQAKRANELYQALDGKQRKIALLGTGRPEEGTQTVKLTGKTKDLPGLPVSEMTEDQKKLSREVMSDLLAPFREKDRQDSMKMVEANGFDNLHFSYYKNQDIGEDGVWDVWQVEGPAMLWYFRGAPHVHTWVHIREKV